MITVIADDITGAAEIAGIAWRHGVKTVLSTGFTKPGNDVGVLVIATDTRSGNKADAITETRRIAKSLSKEDGIIFKKTDSVLRGHVVDELETLINVVGYSQALLLPQNPSKGRTIENGTYFIHGKPLAETAFKDDPEFPAMSSTVTDILSGRATMLALAEDLPHDSQHIYVAEASNFDNIKRQVGKVDAHTMLAGGADAFKALLLETYPKSKARQEHAKIRPCEYSIIMCGSTQGKDFMELPFAKASMTYNEPVPSDVFNGASADAWLSSLPNIYAQHKSLAITIKQKENGGPRCALRLRSIMAEAALLLTETQKPGLLIIEGGATAYSIIKKLNWNNLALKAEYEPGIVGMTHDGTEIIMKPGSYSWGNGIL